MMSIKFCISQATHPDLAVQPDLGGFRGGLSFPKESWLLLSLTPRGRVRKLIIFLVCMSQNHYITSLILHLRVVRAPAAAVVDGRVQDDGLLVVRVAEVGREVRLQVFVLARLRLAADASHVDTGALRG